MKLSVLVLCFVFLPFKMTAQGSVLLENLLDSSTLNLQDTLLYGTKSIEFLKVIEDSRCPKDRNCFWSGKATALVRIYENGTHKEDKELVFGADHIQPYAPAKLCAIDQKILYVYDLYPYPSSTGTSRKSLYYLQFVVK
ncbi:hypothetical protein J8281_13170 [Aquimarina sp. U1-2]|uniref:hypothetical protein n=1 Tax=Aquimarina sp. U1-2 TaxID=2823141 RepID=UPI001AED06D1|nr:hypothetical protein [Aquimarina sp. U1-2]MBP2833138.1 hypothetical protein [Aquimarina sp. U1-2]